MRAELGPAFPPYIHIHICPPSSIPPINQVTYDICRSVPALTLLWAGGAIAACNLGVQNVLKASVIYVNM